MNAIPSGRDAVPLLRYHSISHEPIMKSAGDGRKYEYYLVSVAYSDGDRAEFLIDEGLKDVWVAMTATARDSAIHSFYQNNKARLLKP